MTSPSQNTARYGYTYQDYMTCLSELLAAAPTGTVIKCGDNLGATLMYDMPVWFDLNDGGSQVSGFDRSAWNDREGCWDGETPEQTWGALENPQFVAEDQSQAPALEGVHYGAA